MQINTDVKRTYLPESLQINSWEDIAGFFEELADRNIKNPDDLRQWFRDRSELEAFISEDAGWRYIRMTCDTANEEYQKAYSYFISEIEPKIAPFSNKLNKKALESPFLDDLRQKEGYGIMIREMEKDVQVFREENIRLKSEAANLSKEYGNITGAMTVEIDGHELTLQQAAVILESKDREKRKEAYEKIQKRRLQDNDKLNELYTKLIHLRHQMAKNAGFDNYRDYMFTAMGRFDYEPQDCFDFHASVKEEIVPLLNNFAEERKQKLQLDSLRPYDKAVDPSGKDPLKPFSNTDELTEKSIEVFSKIDPFLGECLTTMRNIKHLDLGSRKGKAPGGYNYPLSEIGVPFIFMNATSTLRDMVTLMHEGGHAVHSIITKDLELTDFKHTPSEVAELASMSMELISMDQWHLFFEDEESLKRAKKAHLEQVIDTLPWVALIDKFQHWIYEHPDHHEEDRYDAWERIFDEFTDDVTDWSGLEAYRANTWQKQLHLYEVPFYYIEYGFAQLGAIAVWKNYKENGEKGLEGYLNALKLGYTRSIPEIYEAANIKFDFSRSYIKELIEFVKSELNKI
jgi:oligoendopeptidase F